jgi:integrase
MASIDKREGPQGVKWRARVRVRGVTRTETFDRKTDATAWAREIESAIVRGTRVPSASDLRRTTGELIDAYLEYLPHKPRNRSRISSARKLNWWREQIGSMLLVDLTPHEIEQAVRRLKAEPTKHGKRRGPATVNRYLAALSGAFKYGQRKLRWPAIEENPVRHVDREDEPDGREEVLEPDELSRLLEQCRKSRNRNLYPLTVLALATGARRGELLKLRWRDVDLKAGSIKLTKTSTKTYKTRTVPLVGPALEIMKERAKVRRIDTDLAFPNRDGTKPAEPRTAWEEAVKRAGLADYRFHDNRHTAATFLQATGASDIEIAAILGHETLQMVKRYAKARDQEKRAALERIAGMFGDG